MNTIKPKAIMFDLDGTLLDTAPDFIVALNALLNEENCKPCSPELIRKTVSNGSRALITLGFGIDEHHSEFSVLRERLLELYTDSIAVHTKLFPGMQKVLNNIHVSGLHWGIATNKPELYTQLLLDKINIQPPCELVICPDNVSEPKPHPESLYQAAAFFSCTPAEIIYIGDHLRDIECGIAAGSPTIACAYGYVDDSIHTWGANHIVQHARDIWPIIEKHTKGSSA